MNWCSLVTEVSKHVIKIEAGESGGTGFFVDVPEESNANCCVLTAWHVIANAYSTNERISLKYLRNGEPLVTIVPANARTVIAAKARDQAIILFNIDVQYQPSLSLRYPKANEICKSGLEVGWLGFPVDVTKKTNAADAMCFFCGHISAYLNNEESYLIDGVAINGVSGGPVFVPGFDGWPVIVGLMTNYYANNRDKQSNNRDKKSETWPGLSKVRTINPLMKLYDARRHNKLLNEVSAKTVTA